MPGSSSSERLRAAREARDADRAGGRALELAGTAREDVAGGTGSPRLGAACPPGGGRAEGAGSAAATPPAAGDLPPPIRIMDVSGRLPLGAPPRVVRDPDGRISVDTPDARQVSGRGLRDVHDVIAMPGLGAHLVDAMFRRAVGRADSAWVGYAVAARLVVGPLRDLKLAHVRPSALPFDLFPRIEEALLGEIAAREAARAEVKEASRRSGQEGRPPRRGARYWQAIAQRSDSRIGEFQAIATREQSNSRRARELLRRILEDMRAGRWTRVDADAVMMADLAAELGAPAQR